MHMLRDARFSGYQKVRYHRYNITVDILLEHQYYSKVPPSRISIMIVLKIWGFNLSQEMYPRAWFNHDR